MYAYGEGVREDDADAVKWFRKAAEQGNPTLQSIIGLMFASGLGIPQDYFEGAKWRRKAADQGNASAQYSLGVSYDTGEGVRQDHVEAVKWYRLAADQGNADAQYNLGISYSKGEGVRQDYVEAVKWHHLAAVQGNPKAQLQLGSIYGSGRRGVPQDDVESFNWYRKAADQGHYLSQYSVGDMYKSGKGVQKNAVEAIKWFRKAAEQGYALAQSAVGDMYEYGEGVRQDYAEAQKWYRMAAEQGDASSQNRLGDLYAEGNGVRQNYLEAQQWYRKAADQGNPYAQYKLGVMYLEGYGIRQDDAEALKWINRVLANHTIGNKLKAAALQASNTLLRRQGLERRDTSPEVAAPVVVDSAPPQLKLSQGPQQTIQQGDHVLTGQAIDHSQIAEIRVDGVPIPFSRQGTFSVKRFFAIGQTVLNLAATDIYGNTATQRVTVQRDPSSSVTSSEDESRLQVPSNKARNNPNAVALIVGVEDYRNAPKAKWAAQDAGMFYDYAQRSLGIPAGNIKLLTGDAANRTGMLSALKTWLAPMVVPGKSQVYVYFAGHGLAAAEGDKAYLIPQDGDPSLLEDTALERQRLFDEIAKAKPLSTTVFLDTCYSGGTRGGEGTLVANARPIMIKSKTATLPPGFMQFSAARNNQLAHSHPTQQHGLFSYYLMRGLSGEADANQDKILTAGELQDYVQAKVKRMALTQGRPQEPELIGDRERIIANWSR